MQYGIQICIAASDTPGYNSDALLHAIIAKSTFTPKQIAIISKRLSGGGPLPRMTSGAYYRQVGQCKEKTIAVMYSLVLLELMGAVDQGTAEALSRIGDQLRVIFAPENRDVVMQSRAEDVISVIDRVIQRVCKV